MYFPPYRIVYPLWFTTMHNYPYLTHLRVHRKTEKIKTCAKTGHRLYPNFTPVTEGRSMKDACGCLVLESFNTTRGVRVGRQHRSKSKRLCAGKRYREEKRRGETDERVREKGLERKGIFRMIGIVGDARDAECRGVESAVFKWGGH